MGQDKPVTIVRLVARGTIEEKVLELHAKKRGLVEGVLGDADVAGKLSTDELVDLLRGGGKVEASDEPRDEENASPAPDSLEVPPADVDGSLGGKLLAAAQENWQGTKSASTASSYLSVLRRMLGSSLSEPGGLSRIENALQKYARTTAAKSTPTTRRSQRSTLRSALEVGVERRLVTEGDSKRLLELLPG
jgi:hypothetical protein